MIEQIPSVLPVSQADYIEFYNRVRCERNLSTSEGRWTHYEHLLFTLGKIIESYGPTLEYQEWVK